MVNRESGLASWIVIRELTYDPLTIHEPRFTNHELRFTTMAKTVTAQIRLQCPGGQATPAPPVGPALGQHGVNIGQFVSQFNDRTKESRGVILPVVITVYSDRTFEFAIKSPPAAVLLKQAAGIPIEKKKGGESISAEEKAKRSGKYKGFKVSGAQVREIAQRKLND